MQFVNKLRGKLYDVGAAMGHVMRKKRNKEEFTMDDLLDIFTFEKIQVCLSDDEKHAMLV